MKSKKLLLFAVVAAFAVITLPAAAQLGPWGLPWGTYAFTGSASCLASSGFDDTLTATGSTSVSSFTSTGTFTFNAYGWKTVTGSGTAKFTNVGYSIDGSGSGFSQALTLPFTYTVGKDGALTVVPGTLSGTNLTGPNPGDTFTKVGLASFTGQIALNGSIVLTSSTTGVETYTLFNSSGTEIGSNMEICHRTRTLVPVLP
jgi:hypothetical protein